MFVQRVDVLDGYWTKPAFVHYMILRELRKPESQRLQWLFWFDADTIVLNYNIALEMFLPPDNDEALKDINVLISDDWNGLNNGIFGIRVSRSAAELFAGILAFRDFEPDTQLTFVDQSAMELMLKRRKFVNHVAKVPQRVSQSAVRGIPSSSYCTHYMMQLTRPHGSGLMHMRATEKRLGHRISTLATSSFTLPVSAIATLT